MYLELRFTQKLRSATLVQDSKWLDITLRQTAVKGDASRTQMVVMSFGQGNGGGGKLQKHASTHFKGGSDTIKPYDIDAAKRGGDKGQDFAAREVDSEAVKVAGQIVSDNYIGGLLGSGFKFDAQKGELELRKLRVWEELITSVLVKNEVQIMRNEMWFTDGGTVTGLIADGSLTNDQRRVQFKEKPSFRTGDLLKAIVEFTDGGAGFRTAQYRVDALHNDGFSATVTLVNGIEPVQDMVVARIGNDTDVERQKSVYIDGLTGYIRQLGGMTSFEVTAANVLWHIGNTSGLAALGIDNSEYTDTLYMPSLHVTGDQLIGGRINALDGFNLIDFGKSLVDGLRFRLGDKGSFMQFLDGVFELHNVRLISKDGTVSEGKDGKDGNYSVAIYRWTDGVKPESPQGVGGAGPSGDAADPSPAGWSLGTEKGVVITSEKGAALADENGAALINAYPDYYKLWRSEGTFDGSTRELIRAWSDPYQASATDGEKGKDGTDGIDGKDGEKGEKGDAGKDVDPAVLAQLQADNAVLKAKTKGFTEIEGGLMTTNIIKLTNTDRKEMAGISGICVDDAGNNLPAFWAGGSYVKAIEGKSSIVMWHNGVAKIGSLNVDLEGVVSLKNATGASRLLLLPGNVTPASEFKGLDGSGSASYPQYSITTIGNSSYQYPQTLTVTKNNSTLVVKSSLIAYGHFGADEGVLYNYSQASLYLVTPSGKRIELGSVDSRSPRSRMCSINNTFYGVAAGVYRFYVESFNSILVEDAFFAPSVNIGAGSMAFSFVAKIQKLEIGDNGYQIVWDKDNYERTTIENGTLVKEFQGVKKVRGVQCTGRVLADGYNDGCWGELDRLEVSKESQGRYKIAHYLGHTKYRVFANIYGMKMASLTCRIEVETNDYAIIRVHDNTNLNTVIDCDVNYQIVGEPKK